MNFKSNLHNFMSVNLVIFNQFLSSFFMTEKISLEKLILSNYRLRQSNAEKFWLFFFPEKRWIETLLVSSISIPNSFSSLSVFYFKIAFQYFFLSFEILRNAIFKIHTEKFQISLKYLRYDYYETLVAAKTIINSSTHIISKIH